MTRDADYWAGRRKELLAQMEADEERLNKRLAKVYDRQARQLEREIAAYYQQYGEQNVIRYRDLLHDLSDTDRKLLMERMDDFAEKYPQYADLMPVRESIYKLNRLEGIQTAIRMQQLEIGAIEQEELDEHFKKLAQRSANLAAEEMGFGKEFYRIDSKVIEETIGKRWTNGKNFSERIWDNREKLAAYLNDDFAQMVARGDSYEKAVKALRERFEGVSERDIRRLVFTEGTFLTNEAQARAHETEYEYYALACADSKACDVCKQLQDEQLEHPARFDERAPGVNFPPMHPWCRCGYTIEVPDYEEWSREYDRRHGVRRDGAKAALAEIALGGVSGAISGADSGALNEENDPGAVRRDEHAKLYYEEVRNRDSEAEIDAVAASSGMSREIVGAVYRHVFIDEHDLSDGHRRFDPDYDMAQSWQRLRSGKNVQRHDLMLILHEYEESKLMTTGIPYAEAHDTVCAMGYDYQKELEEWLYGKEE